MLDDVFERLERTVVHIRRGHRDIAQSRGLERADFIEGVRHREPAEFGDHRIGEHRLVDGRARRFRLEEFGGETRHVALNAVDADADVVEPVVGEERLRLFDGVAGHASSLTDVKVEAAFGLIADGVAVAAEIPLVEGRIARDDRALEARDRLLDVIHRHVSAALAERLLEALDIGGIFTNDLEHRLVIGQPHFHGIDHRVLRLILQRNRTSVPELRGVIGRVDDRRGVARAGQLMVTLGNPQRTVRESFFVVMTGRAAHRAVDREARVMEQLVAERDLFRRLRIIRRNRDFWQAERLGHRPAAGGEQRRKRKRNKRRLNGFPNIRNARHEPLRDRSASRRLLFSH